MGDKGGRKRLINRQTDTKRERYENCHLEIFLAVFTAIHPNQTSYPFNTVLKKTTTLNKFPKGIFSNLETPLNSFSS